MSLLLASVQGIAVQCSLTRVFNACLPPECDNVRTAAFKLSRIMIVHPSSVHGTGSHVVCKAVVRLTVRHSSSLDHECEVRLAYSLTR